MHYHTTPSNQLHAREFVSDGSYARFVNVDGEWHMSLAPGLAEHVDVGTAVTCDVETKAGKRYTRSGTVVRTQQLPNGIRRALCTIEEFRAGRANDERNTFAMLPDGSWGVRLHASASRNAHVDDIVRVAVTAKSGRVAHVTARVTGIAENEHGDRQALAEIVERDNARMDEPVYRAGDGVTDPCPSCGTTSCDAGIVGHCRLSPEHVEGRYRDVPLADTERDGFELSVESIARAQDDDHWSARIDRGERVRAIA